jgi:hypothetical protein
MQQTYCNKLTASETLNSLQWGVEVLYLVQMRDLIF